MKKLVVHTFAISGLICGLTVLSTASFADDTKAIWGTDGAGITNSQPQLKKEVSPKKPDKQTIKSTVENVKAPNISKPTTSPNEITGQGTKPAPSDSTK